MIEQVLTMILKNGTPTGIIECSIDEWFGISYKIPRNKLKEAAKLKYINNTGIYILFGEDEETAERSAYIGEAENIIQRLEQQDKEKDYWNECIVFMSENNSLTKAHIKFVEHELYELAKKVGRFTVKNKTNPTKSSLGNADEIKALKFVEKIKCITSMMGYRLFDKLVENEEVEDDNLLYLTNNGILYATGLITDEGFVILKGSKLKEGISEGISKSLIPFVERERNSNDIKEGTFIANHLCTSPSMASVLIMGRNSNGYQEWKNKDGRTLKDILGR